MVVSVILTRPSGMNERLAGRLSEIGMRPISLPALVLQPRAVRNECFPDAADYDLVVFVSGNAVRFYMDQRQRMLPGAAWPNETRVATVGSATALAAQQAGVSPANIISPDPALAQDSESLWKRLQRRLRPKERVLIVRGDAGREWLGSRLEEAGAIVDRYAAYERRPAQWSTEESARLAAALETSANRICLLTSNEGLSAVYANLTRLGLEDAWSALGFVVVHERIAQRLQSVFSASGKVAPRMVKICQPSDDAIFQTMVKIASLSASS